MNKFEKAEEHGRTQELSWSLLVFRHFRHFRHFRQDNVKTLEERADTERERKAERPCNSHRLQWIWYLTAELRSLPEWLS